MNGKFCKGKGLDLDLGGFWDLWMFALFNFCASSSSEPGFGWILRFNDTLQLMSSNIHKS